jgi:hypothetical protein
MKKKFLPTSFLRRAPAFLLALAGSILSPAAQAQTSWNAFNDFYVDTPATAGDGLYPQTKWITNTAVPFNTGFTNANAWGYAGGNFNGFGNPTSVGTYVSGGAVYSLRTGNTYAGPGVSFDLGGGNFWIGYNDQYGIIGVLNAATQIGKYTQEWFGGTPNYTNNPNGLNNKFLWIQPTGLSASTDGLGAMLTWTAPNSGKFDVRVSYVNGNYGQSTAFAIVDSLGNTNLSRQLLAPASSQNNTAFTKSYSAGDVIQFQVGTPAAAQGSPLGLAVNIVQITTTNWNAARDFYLSPTAGGWTGATTPSEAGSAWGYYMGNVNGGGSFPTTTGTYLTSGQIYKYTSHNPADSSDGTVYGNSLWGATGGAGFARYRDTLLWGTSLGFFDTPWFSGAPGNTTEARGGVWMQANSIGNPNAEGIAPVVTWTAPYSGIYDFKGSFQVGINGLDVDNGASIAIVASTGSNPMSKVSATQGMDYPFAFRRTLNQGDVIQFQVGTDFKVGAAVGLNADVTRVGDVGQKVPSSVNLAGSSTLAYTGSGVTPSLTILGSTTPPTYSYQGVDGTSYAPSSNAPTSRGRYEVTVTTADDATWSSATNKFYYSVGTFNAFKDFWWNRTNGRSAWMDPTQAQAQGRSQGTPTSKNAWGYGLFDCTNQTITDANVDTTFQALAGYSHDSNSPSWTYHNGDPSGTRVSWIAANSNNAVLALAPSAGVDGGDGLAAAVRWTAPTNGTYRFQGSFVSQGNNSMSVAIHTYGGDEGNVINNTTYLGRTTVAASATQTFDFTNYIEANQTVTWVVGSDGASTGDVMLLSANVLDVTGVTSQPPTITSAATINVAENQTAVQTVTAVASAGATLTYSILGGADALLFFIDGSSGALTFVSAPNFESPADVGSDNVYNVTVQVSDGSQTATLALVVTVTNVAEGSTFAGAYPGRTFMEVAHNGLTYLVNYAFGGNSTTAATLPQQDHNDPTKLRLIVVVRNDDSSVSVGGQASTSLTGAWSSAGVTVTNAADQNALPANTSRKVISVDRGSDPAKFIRATVTKTP